MKKCSKCQETKDKKSFNASKKSPDGLFYYCKECQKEYARSRYEKSQQYLSAQESRARRQAEAEKAKSQRLLAAEESRRLKEEKLLSPLKKCNRCSVEKEKKEFHTNRSSHDNLKATCRECVNQRASELRALRRPEPTEEELAERKAAAADRRKARGKEYYWKNREAILEKSRIRRAQNPKPRRKAKVLSDEERKAKQRAAHHKWYSKAENRKKASTYHKQRRQNNREAFREYRRNRRAREANKPVDLPPNFWDLLVDAYGAACMNPDCRGWSDELTLDHVIPLSKGGEHAMHNFQILCKSCNSSKGSRHTADYRKVYHFTRL